jgi:hypothetical protein
METTENMNQIAKVINFSKNSISFFLESWNHPISKEGEFEVLIFGACIGFLHGLEKGLIERNNDSIEHLNFLLFKEMHIQNFMEQESLKGTNYFRVRLNALKKDLVGMAMSDYPKTKQYIPYYTFNCINYEPLKVEQDLSWAKSGGNEGMNMEKRILASDFLRAYSTHHNLINRSLSL